MAKRMAKKLKPGTNKRVKAFRGFGSRDKSNKAPVLLRFQATWLFVRKLALAFVMVSLIGGGLFVSFQALNKPLELVQLNARFERVSTLDVEKVLAKYKQEKLLSIDLDKVRLELESIDWVDRAEVKRSFPAGLKVNLSEHVAAARWGESGLLNTRGEIILKNARYLPPELPRLDGPEGSEWQVAQQYLELRKNVLRYGLNIKYLGMDARGGWSFDLSNGMQVRIGREATDQRFYRFSYRVLPLLFKLPQTARVVDMRYSNGFAVQWKNVSEESMGQTIEQDQLSSQGTPSLKQKAIKEFHLSSQHMHGSRSGELQNV